MCERFSSFKEKEETSSILGRNVRINVSILHQQSRCRDESVKLAEFLYFLGNVVIQGVQKTFGHIIAAVSILKKKKMILTTLFGLAVISQQ